MVVLCREDQERALQVLLNGEVCPQSIALCGVKNTGKTFTLKEVLKNIAINNTWIRCDQCSTTRVLLQRALAHIFTSTSTGTQEDASCENVDIFFSLLSNKFREANYTQRHILVLDRIDKLPDKRALSDTIYGFTRFSEFTTSLNNFTIVFLYSTKENSVFTNNPAIPRVWFPYYTADEIRLLLNNDLTLSCNSEPVEFRTAFIDLVINAFSSFVGCDIVALKRAAEKIYLPLIEGRTSESDSVAKLYMRKSYLFKPDFLEEKLGGQSTEERATIGTVEYGTDESIAGYLLCAAYLASYTPPRYDMRCFSLAKTMRNKRRETRPKKSATIPARSLTPPTFEMERLLAIFHSILPDAFEFQADVRVGRQLATLSSQNLIVRSQNDVLDSRTKWKINAPWSYVQLVSEKIGFDIENYLLDDI